jgi:hypothetical protein
MAARRIAQHPDKGRCANAIRDRDWMHLDPRYAIQRQVRAQLRQMQRVRLVGVNLPIQTRHNQRVQAYICAKVGDLAVAAPVR